MASHSAYVDLASEVEAHPVTKSPKSSWTDMLRETTHAPLETLIERVQANTSGRTILVALLGPSSAGPSDDDGWFAADFAMAYHIYGDIGGEQTWLTCVDLVQEAQSGPYLWGHPKEKRTVVFSSDDDPFYTLSEPQHLIATYKTKLESVVASMRGDDRLLLLIFAHGEERGSTGILVGADTNGEYGVLTVQEVNSILQPLAGSQCVTLITSACYSGEWHDDTRTTLAASNKVDESLSFPASAAQCCWGGYFWSPIWYELSRLGVPMGKDIREEEKFQSWTECVQRRVQELMSLNPVPTVSVEHEAIFKKHAREVVCLQLEKAGFSFTSSLRTVPRNPHPDLVSDEDAALHHFTGSRGSSSSGGHPTFHEDPDTKCFTLPVLLEYFDTCNPGLPNAASCSQVYRLVRLYKTGLATKSQTSHLYKVLLYRFQQDLRAGYILSFLRIPRVCHIFHFKQWLCDMEIMSPYIMVVRLVYPFDDPPKTTPPSYRYTKPGYYLACTAYKAGVDVSWLKENLELFKLQMSERS